MITEKEGIFYLNTKNTTYVFGLTKFKHLEHIYYGTKVTSEVEIGAIRHKQSAQTGTTVMYDPSDENYSMDTLPLEWSGCGRGDYRNNPLEAKMSDGTFITDFTFQKYEIIQGNVPMQTLPSAYGTELETQTLVITLFDEIQNVTLTLYYSVYEACDVITRRVVMTNHAVKAVSIRKIQSMMIDLKYRNYDMVTFDGGWIREAHKHTKEVTYGMLVNSSTTGNSSNRHNPGFVLAEHTATQDHGWVYGFNLVYSGNHYSCVERSNRDLVRVSIGINPHCFEWQLKQDESFETPEAVMTFSPHGFNGMSHQFHDFINQHIIRGDWKGKERPILINNWESDFFDFHESGLLKLAGQASKLGIELFVLDDGWFGERNHDKAGLGDYQVNHKKLPHGLTGLSKKIKAMGMDFGLWFEPEMINEDSELYRRHPEYAVKVPGRKPVKGRNQLVLDLCKEEVRQYIIEQVGTIIDEAELSYVKWDMNRHISEMYSEALLLQGEFAHRYVTGLYEILQSIFGTRPHVLLESCASGGNRFDLGMLCFSPQIWVSDDTDPIERLKIQEGLSYLYPQSTFGAHVSMAPHQQTLRNTPLSTRFNVAAFGCLGFELDLKQLSPVEKKEVKDQIVFYKRYRELLQYGIFSRHEQLRENQKSWQVTSRNARTALAGFYQTLGQAAVGMDQLSVRGLQQDVFYSISTRPQNLYLDRFGGLIKHAMPIKINPKGAILRTANQIYSLKDCVETYQASGRMLEAGICLNDQFMGTGYHNNMRMLGDYGSNIYLIEQNIN